MHCDVDQEASVEHIWQCLDVIEVERIDHGVNAIEDEELCREIVRRGLGLTVCPISNAYVTDGTKADIITELLTLGIKVTINSDDPAYFPGYLVENLLRLQQEADLDTEAVARLVRNAFEISWLEPDQRSGYLARVDAFVDGH